MSEEMVKDVRDAVMKTFRDWGGQWNVTPREPGSGEVPAGQWQIRVRSHPIVRAFVPTAVVEAYVNDPDEPGAKEAWEEALRPIFDDAKAQAG